jgi:hypothetical protein
MRPRLRDAPSMPEHVVLLHFHHRLRVLCPARGLSVEELAREE